MRILFVFTLAAIVVALAGCDSLSPNPIEPSVSPSESRSSPQLHLKESVRDNALKFISAADFQRAVDSVEASGVINVSRSLYQRLRKVVALSPAEIALLSDDGTVTIGSSRFRFSDVAVLQSPNTAAPGFEHVDIYFGASGRQHIDEYIRVVANSDSLQLLGDWLPEDPTARAAFDHFLAAEGGDFAWKTAGTDTWYLYPAGMVPYGGGADFPAANYGVRYVFINVAYGDFFSGRKMSATTGTAVRPYNFPFIPYQGIQSANWGLATRFWVQARVRRFDELCCGYGYIEVFTEDAKYAEVTVSQWRRANEGSISMHWASAWRDFGFAAPPTVSKWYAGSGDPNVQGTYVFSNAAQLGYSADASAHHLQ